MAEQILSSSGGSGNRAIIHVLDRCRQDPGLADAVLSLLDVCAEMDAEDPGAAREFVRGLEAMGDLRRQAQEVR
jgi:hypothetical protein